MSTPTTFADTRTWSLPKPSLRLRLFLLALLALAFLLRIHHLYASGFWFDETASYFIASKGLPGILAYARQAPGEHPPAYYLLLSLWMNAAGSHEFSLRYFSVWFGTLFVALFYRFTRRHFKPELALLAATLSVAMPFLVDYSQEARMYTLVLCLAVLAMDYFLRWAAGDARAAYKYFLFLLLAISVHYYAALLLAAHDIYLVSRRELWRTMGKWTILSHALLAGAFALWLFNASGAIVSAGRTFSNPIFAGRTLGELSRIAIDLTVGGVVIRPLADADYLLAGLAWLIILLGIFWARRHLDHWSRGSPLRSWLFAVAIVPPLLATVVPYVYAARYLFVIVPALLLLAAGGLLALRRLGAGYMLIGATLVFLLPLYGLNLTYSFIKSPYREMAAVVNREARPADGVILEGTGQWPLVLYYLHGPSRQTYIPNSIEAAELVDIDEGMRAMQQAHARLWVLSEEPTSIDPGDNVARWLSLNAFPIARMRFKDGDAVASFESGRTLSAPTEWNTQFGEWLLLERSSMSPLNVRPGDGLAVDLHWHALKKIPQPLQLLVTLRLFDGQGHLLAERVSKPCDGFCAIDDWVPGESVDDRHGLIVPVAAAPGDYSLRLEIFSPRQGQSLPVTSAQGPLGTSLELARIAVRAAASSAP